MSTADIIVMFWFVLSLIVTIIIQQWLRSFLSHRNYIGAFNAFAATPGYLDAAYIRWCRDNNRSYGLLIVVRIFFLVSFVVAGILSSILLKNGR